ncbi:MAG TPA: RNB domain-containing ribonuclease, partial [Thermohalobaculum sp.]|nr:RNB domain-containing ribonuclease [Thermohalobaculum sp.]
MTNLPTKPELLDWIRENPEAAGKREIARAFNIKGGARVELKAMLRELEDEGHLTRRRKRVRPKGHLPPVGVIVIEGPDADGDLRARPREWEDGAAPPIVVLPRKNDPALGTGDQVLAKLHAVHTDDGLSYEARPIKRLGGEGTRRMLGIYRAGPEAGRVVPVAKGAKGADKEWIVPRGAAEGSQDGELVEAEALPGRRLGLPHGRIVARLGDPGAPRQVSLIAMHEHGISYEFPAEVLGEAEAAEPVALGDREDLRDLALVTIDPEDARDHDDAVCAFADDDSSNPGGWIVWVAIADVAHYVRPDSELDREARRRGNSTYFPDRVAPMLPERLSADLCSLMEGVDRPCLAVRLVLNEAGEKIGHRFTRGLMRSRASLSYEQAQAAANGDAPADALRRETVEALFAAWA